MLATYGSSIHGLYVHVKVYKQRRIFGEVTITGHGARVELTCRDCLRHHVVRIRDSEVDFRQIDLDEHLRDSIDGDA